MKISLSCRSHRQFYIKKKQSGIMTSFCFCFQDCPDSRATAEADGHRSSRIDRIIVLVVLVSGLGLLALTALLVRQRSCGHTLQEKEARKLWLENGRYVTAVTLAGEKATADEHRPCLGLMIDTTQAMNDFSSGQSASCPLYESSSDLLLLRVEDCRVRDTDQLLSNQRRSLNWDSGAAKSQADRILSKLSSIFENSFQQHKYIDVK